jgi:hypothetical protein
MLVAMPQNSPCTSCLTARILVQPSHALLHFCFLCPLCKLAPLLLLLLLLLLLYRCLCMPHQAFLEHIHDEEHRVLPALRAACEPAQLKELGVRFEQAKRHVPTRHVEWYWFTSQPPDVCVCVCGGGGHSVLDRMTNAHHMHITPCATPHCTDCRPHPDVRHHNHLDDATVLHDAALDAAEFGGEPPAIGTSSTAVLRGQA